MKPYFPCRTVGLDFIETAPQRYVNEVELDVTPERLFEILDDEHAWPLWATGLKRVDWTTPRPHGPGATRTVTFVGGGMEVYEYFFVWEPGKELAFYLTGASQEVWSAFAERYQVAPLPGGRCRLTWTLAYDPVGGFAKRHWLVRPLLGRGLRDFLKRLARYCRDNPVAGAKKPKNPYERAVDALAGTAAGAFVARRVANAVDTRLLRWTKGRFSSGVGTSYGDNIVLLTAIGAKTGQPRTVPLLHTPFGDEVIFVASNAGEEAYPAWYNNLKKTPRCEVEIHGVKRTYVAREVEGQERDDLWKAACANYPGYEKYKTRTSRVIPVMRLTPVA